MVEVTVLRHFSLDMQLGYKIVVDVSTEDLERMELTPEYIKLEFERLFSPRRTPQAELEDGVKSFFEITDDISKLYVDHLCTNLEKRSIFEIVVFLSRYCGWDRIKKQIDNYMEILGRGN